ncbi:GntR family transcriptional regulator [Roseateles toxinivorans]|uniref:GntR family transcriptional regulator n=1 Tax=Roseateles toxinivorans TaxID=270368 RepID=A0A4R6QID3_9BURK|nr:GntR family transcriptional regulator [Roseateles toxinivorans]
MPISVNIGATDALALPLRGDGESLHQWLFAGLRAGILQSRLPAGLKLPSSRALASQIGVARGTVTAIYDELAAQGYLECAVGRGSFVAHVLPERPQVARRTASLRPATVRGTPLSEALGVREVWTRTPFPQQENATAAVPFRAHLPDTRMFPLDVWRKLAAHGARALSPGDLTSTAITGLPLLREAIAGHLAAARGVSTDPRQILVVSSAQEAMDLSVRLLCSPNQTVWLEDPGYVGARAIMAAHGLRVANVPVDDQGLAVAEGIRLAPQARLACITPSRQSPLGMPMSVARRSALLNWATRAGSFLIEDDYDSEYRYGTRPIPALKSMDCDDRVLLLGTFSKLMFPALRLAYLVLPQALVEPFTRARSLLGRGLPALEQAMTARFILDGHFERHLRRSRAQYAARAQALRHAIGRHARGLVEPPAIDAGLDVAVRLRTRGNDRAAQRQLMAAGIEAVALSRYATDARLAPGLVLGFAAFDESQIESAVRQLAVALGRQSQ